MALELHGEIENRLLQQAALGADLVRGNSLVFRTERGVEDLQILWLPGVALRECLTTREQCDGRTRQHERIASRWQRRRQKIGEQQERHRCSPFEGELNHREPARAGRAKN
jgi:hypothetical protein